MDITKVVAYLASIHRENVNLRKEKRDIEDRQYVHPYRNLTLGEVYEVEALQRGIGWRCQEVSAILYMLEDIFGLEMRNAIENAAYDALPFAQERHVPLF
jgi:hypothetical protein